MKILIVGGGSLLANFVIRNYVSNGDTVAVVYRSSSISSSDYLSIKYTDFTAIEKFNADLVFYLASSMLPRDPIEKALSGYALDTKYLIELIPRFTGKSLIFFSSGGAIYGEAISGKSKETDKTFPKSMYAISKKHMEELIIFSSSQFGFNYKILRLSNPYGTDGKLLLKRGLIYNLIRNGKLGIPFELVAPIDTQKDYIDIEDLMSCIKKITSNESSGIYNVGSGLTYSISNIISLVESIFKLDINIKYNKISETDVHKSEIDISKIMKIGFSPKFNLNSGLLKIKDFIENDQ
jgi:UDP-glucose 4-epimerase